MTKMQDCPIITSGFIQAKIQANAQIRVFDGFMSQCCGYGFSKVRGSLRISQNNGGAVLNVITPLNAFLLTKLFELCPKLVAQF
jgi:hypothetical protein